MKLLGHGTSINVRKALWTCAEIGVKPDRNGWTDDLRPGDIPGFATINPKGLVPVLIDGDLVVTESNTICRYLARKAGRCDLLPADPSRQAMVEAWMDWQATELNNAWRAAFMGLVRRDARFLDPAPQQASIDAWNREMTLLENRLDATGAYVCGEAFTLADIVLGLSANRWEMTPMPRPDLPAITAWMERMSARPGFGAHCRNGIA